MTLQVVHSNIALQGESCYAVENDVYIYSRAAMSDDDFDEHQAVAAWLSEKFDVSQSQATLKNYKSTITRFQAFLAEHGLGLDPWRDLTEATTDRQRRRMLGQFAIKIREFAEVSAKGKAVATATYEMRLKAISSFYQFCNKYDMLFCGNPVERIKRPRIQPYQHSRALDIEDVAKSMARIDRTKRKGCRDYALLAVLLETGRRIGEVLRLQWRDLTRRADGSLEIYFSRTKGGKTKRDLLSRETSEALLTWVRLSYGGKTPKKTASIWTSLSSRSADKHIPLGYEACRAIMMDYLGTTSVHRARHTWAAAMRRLGATLEELGDGLGHSSYDVTRIYDQHVREIVNPRREGLAKLFGLTQNRGDVASEGD
ncbi:MAG: tyrosine-type recombinase/integrase [Ktedonobacteraceae bacterium]